MMAESPTNQYPERIPQTRLLTVAAGQAAERIDIYLTRSVLRATRNKVQEAIADGAVLVNGRPTKSNYKVRPGDVIQLTLMKPPPIELIPQDIPLDILHEDEDVLVITKPAGLVTHPAYGNHDGTLLNAVLFHVGGSLLQAVAQPPNSIADDSGNNDEPLADDPTTDSLAADSDDGDDDDLLSIPRPGIVHRLDKDTSGVMVIAKTMGAISFLAKQFADRTVKREYWAVVWGVVEANEGEIEGNIARDPSDRKKFAVSRRAGKYALTRFRVVERFQFATLLALRLATGRTHQIRVHCAHIRHPLFGDSTYGGAQVVYPGTGPKHRQRVANLLERIPRQALHARTLGFLHPRTGAMMEFDSELPEDMVNLIEELRKG